MAQVKTGETVTVEDAELLFRNFQGKEGKYTAEGDRNFCLVLPEDVAVEMQENGWNIKTLEPREEGDDVKFYVNVALGFNKGKPPNVIMITGGKRTRMDEDTVGMLDLLEFETVDVLINAYRYEVNGGGVKAYLKTMFVVIKEDPLEKKWREMDESRAIESGQEPYKVLQGSVVGDEFED